MTQAFWETFYGDGTRRWSGKPNPSLVAEVAGLAPGRALDLGCGEGADAVWLAAQGWAVTGVDISATALAAAAEHAAEAGVADAITWQRRDLSDGLPSGAFDLVTATFLHSPVALDRTRILRAAAGLVAAGGTLLIIGHAPSASHQHQDLPLPDEVLRDLALPPDGWELRAGELRPTQHAFADEAPAPRVDAVVRLQRNM